MVKQSEKQRKSSRLLPVFGLLLGLAFAFVSFVLLPTVKAYLVRQGISFGGASALTIDLLIGGSMWVVMFGIAMFIVALAVGTHEDDKTAKEYYKRSAQRKKRQKYEEEMKRRRRMAMRQPDQDTSAKK